MTESEDEQLIIGVDRIGIRYLNGFGGGGETSSDISDDCYTDHYSEGISACDSELEIPEDGGHSPLLRMEGDDHSHDDIHGLQTLIERYETQLAELKSLKNKYQKRKVIITSSSLGTTTSTTDVELSDRTLPIHDDCIVDDQEDDICLSLTHHMGTNQGEGSETQQALLHSGVFRQEETFRLENHSDNNNNDVGAQSSKISQLEESQREDNHQNDNNDFNSGGSKSNNEEERRKNCDTVEQTNFPNDTNSFIAVCHPCSTPFFVALQVAAFQIITFSLVTSNVLTLDHPNNPFNIPTNVKTEVRVTQLLAIIISVISQADIRTSLNSFIQGFNKESIESDFPHFTITRFYLSIILRLMEGALGLFVTFLLIVTEETVVDLLLNFTAIEFVSQLDEVCFFMAGEGFFGKHTRRAANEISEKTYRTCEHYQRLGDATHNMLRFILMTVFLIVLFASWLVMVNDQSSGKFLCSTVFVQFGDDFVLTLSAFSGLYDLRIKQASLFSAEYVEYVERRSGLAAFGYCKDLEAWTFRYGEGKTDPCDWVAKSTETTTFDLTQTAETEWSVQNSLYRKINLQHFYLSCYDCDDYEHPCGGRGICHDAVCSCNDGWYGLQCEFREPCPTLEFDERFGPFRGSHKWSSTFDRFKVNDTFVDVYHRPMYVNQYNPGQFDIIVFTGRRFAATASPLIDEVSKNGKTTKEALAKYFTEDFHPGLSAFVIAFGSNPLDVGTPTDGTTPIALQWLSLPSIHMNSSTINSVAKVGLTVHNNVLLCKTCSDSNPCLYDGECINGTCQCSIGASGSICQVTPIGNGHCDEFYNTLEFEYDGGDCCESTCVSTQDFTCGTDESGFVNRGYFFCNQLRDGWRPNGDPMQGDVASGFGLNAVLSNNGKALVVSEPLTGTIKMFDKVGSRWIQRGREMQGPTELGFGSSVAMSASLVHMVNNPLSMVPSMVVVGSSWNPKGYVLVYECSTNGCSQIGPDLLPFELDGIVCVVVDISNDGGVVAAGGRPFPSKESPPNFDIFPLAVFDRDLSVGWKRREIDLVIGESESVYSVALSGDGNILAVAFYVIGFSTDSGTVIENGNIRVYSWNGTYWNQRGSTILGDTLHRALAYQVQGKNMDISDDGNVLAVGLWMSDVDKSLVRMLTWDDYGSDWIQQGSLLACSDFELQGTAVSLASDGLIVAVGSADFNGADGWTASVGMNGTACVFRWNGLDWEQLGMGVPGGHMSSVVLSGDGSSLAVGLAFATLDNAGLTTVYEFPRAHCTNEESLLRISLTTGEDTTATTWDLFSSKTGEIILSGGPYGDIQSFFISVVDETCVLIDDCLVFTIYDNLDLNKPMVYEGMEPPGGHTLFLDGEEIVSGRLEGAVERVVIGNNCSKCPSRTDQFRMMIHTCVPVAWTLMDSSSGETLFTRDNFVEYSNKWDNDCSFGNQTTYWEELCLSLDDECYRFSVFTQRTLNRNGAMNDALGGDDITRTTVRNLQYRLFIDSKQIAMNVTNILPNETNQEPVVSVSVGNCVK